MNTSTSSATNSARLRAALLLLGLCAGLLTYSQLVSTQAQSKQRLLKKGTFPAEPMKVLRLKTKGKDIQSGKKFVEEDDWLKTFAVRLKNISHKPVVFIEISLSFPADENNPDGPLPGYIRDLRYGVEDSSNAAPPNEGPIMPGEVVEITLSEEDWKSIDSAITELSIPRAVFVKVYLRTVVFDDDTMWRAGRILVRDPNEPGMWTTRSQAVRTGKKQQPKHNVGSLLPESSNQLSANMTFEKGIRKMAHALAPVPTPTPIPCSNVVFVNTVDLVCSAASSCKVKKDLYTNNIFFSNRIMVDFEDCRNSSNQVCKENFVPIKQLTERIEPCILFIPGTCNGDADWNAYPLTGCITGLLFGGPCTRSSTFQSRCMEPTGYQQETCSCPDGTSTSPIVIDVDHSGFSLTDADNGVVFKIMNDGVPYAVSWTAPTSTNALLVLDRNGNGTIDDGGELFGDSTPQPPTSSPNGFLALAEYDKASNGGNGNGRIENGDAVYSSLRLWQDANHNGISEPAELKQLSSLISAIDLNYKESKRTDEFGNRFRYRAKVYDVKSEPAGRWAWDVFLQVL